MMKWKANHQAKDRSVICSKIWAMLVLRAAVEIKLKTSAEDSQQAYRTTRKT